MSLNLNRTELRISAGQIRQFPADPMVQIAFSGRSNVGKSSLINSLLGRKSLARVSAILPSLRVAGQCLAFVQRSP